jgi:ribosomal protein S12 methylthiotransferase accessory factor
MDPSSNSEPDALLSRFLDLAAGRYRLVGIPHEDCPAQFIIAIPEFGDGRRTAWLPAAARAGEGRAPSGGGMSRVEALTHCLGEAAELVSSCWWGQESFRRAPAVRLGDAAILPNDLTLISERQYAERDRWNAVHGSYAWLPEPVDLSRPIDWVEAKSPKGDETKLVPAAYVLIGYANAAEPGCFSVGDSNGCAAAGSLEAAVTRGFLELVERDATAIWWYNRCRRPQVELGSLSGHEPLLDWLNGRRRRSHILDITSDLTIPVFAAVSHEPDGSAIALGFGADFNPERAVSSALLEMCQTEISFEIFRRQKTESPHLGLATWLKEVDLSSCSWCQPLSGEIVDIAPKSAGQSEDSTPTLEHCLEICAANHLSLYYVDLTRETIAVSVARTVVPGLRHYKPRFAPGRLYDVPIKIGWQESSTDESQLNPLPLIV